MIPQRYNQIKLLGEKSIRLEQKITRIYPDKNLFSHVVGQIDNDNNGISGIEMSFDKILKRVKNLGNKMEPQLKLNYSPFVMDVIEQLYPDISTTKIDELTAEQCATSVTQHLDYGKLASRIAVSYTHLTLPTILLV